MDFNLKIGLSKEMKEAVTEENIAGKFGSGSIDVYATPAMIGLMEKVSLNMIQPLLPEGFTTVGVSVNVKHCAATPIGLGVRAKSELIEIDGRRLTFRVEAYDDVEKIGEGSHERVIIKLDKFMEKNSKKIIK